MADSDDEQIKQVVYIHSEEYLRLADSLPKVKNRASLTHKLIEAYDLTKKMRVISPCAASVKELTAFHSLDYIECLQQVSDMGDECSEEIQQEMEEYGIGYDCPVFEELYESISMIGGATLTAADYLKRGECSVAINWSGGWHHAHRDEASGFCYVNDIVLGILRLREKFDRVLYVDIDLHHGDGVEDAFSYTPKVMTVSFHKYSEGFFPGTGSCMNVGEGKGKYFTLNIPLKDGVDDKQFVEVFTRTMSEVHQRFQPLAVVCQCGADALCGDPMASFSLTSNGLARCLKYLQSWNLPLLVLGGGGYNFPNTARCWTYITSILVGKSVPLDIPEHDYFLTYGPDYQLDIQPSLKPNYNNNEYLKRLMQQVDSNLKHIFPSLS